MSATNIPKLICLGLFNFTTGDEAIIRLNICMMLCVNKLDIMHIHIKQLDSLQSIHITHYRYR